MGVYRSDPPVRIAVPGLALFTPADPAYSYTGVAVPRGAYARADARATLLALGVAALLAGAVTYTPPAQAVRPAPQVAAFVETFQPGLALFLPADPVFDGSLRKMVPQPVGAYDRFVWTDAYSLFATPAAVNLALAAAPPPYAPVTPPQRRADSNVTPILNGLALFAPPDPAYFYTGPRLQRAMAYDRSSSAPQPIAYGLGPFQQVAPFVYPTGLAQVARETRYSGLPALQWAVLDASIPAFTFAAAAPVLPRRAPDVFQIAPAAGVAALAVPPSPYLAPNRAPVWSAYERFTWSSAYAAKYGNPTVLPAFGPAGGKLRVLVADSGAYIVAITDARAYAVAITDIAWLTVAVSDAEV
jgi:hypothetical protein